MQQIDPAREAYDRSASFYDLVTSADDYDRWVSLYLNLLREHGFSTGRLVDLGCGTGKGALRFASQGFDVTGVDISPEMLRMARQKPGADRVRFVTGDLRRLEELGRFDVAVALGEPFNYLENEGELLAAFQGVARLLTPDGVFLFDLNTSGFYERIATVQQISEHEDLLVLHRGKRSAGKQGGAELRVDHFHSDGPDQWARTSVVHSWSYFAPDVVEHLLRAAGFTQVAERGIGPAGISPTSDESTDRKRLLVARLNSCSRRDP